MSIDNVNNIFIEKNTQFIVDDGGLPRNTDFQWLLDFSFAKNMIYDNVYHIDQ